MLRKTASLFLIIALLFNVCGAYLIFESAKLSIRKEIKKRIKAGVPEEELITLRFLTRSIENGSSGVSWKKSNEFEFEGRMFDIVRTAIDGDYTVYSCINDTQEEELFARLDEMVKETSKHHPGAAQKTRIMLQLLIHEAMMNEKVSLTPAFQPVLLTSYRFVTNPRIYFEIPTPPPNVNA